MKNLYAKVLILSLIAALVSWGFRGDMKTGKAKLNSTLSKTAKTADQTGLVGDAYAFMVNKVQIPLNNTGIMGDVKIGGIVAGTYDGIGFLYSGGFMISGYADTGRPGARAGELWASAVASASRTVDYLKGPWDTTNVNAPPDPNAGIYVVDSRDAVFGPSWQAWSNAVKLGADFYDGDGDGKYNPVDKNGNGKWDPDEDKPDMIGDLTAWCVIHDGVNKSRNWAEMSPRGIDIQQTMFGFRSSGTLGNMVFLRYRIISRGYGQYSGNMDSVYFSVWADADNGDAYDDLIGCDTLRSAGYVYNNGADKLWGSNPACYLTDFFQGPIAYIPGVSFVDVDSNGVYNPGVDQVLTTASNVRGLDKGITRYPGAKNLGLSSFVNYVQSNPDRGDPASAREARNYMTGRLKLGGILDPCTDTFGKVFAPVACATVNNAYWYSGVAASSDAAKSGWVYTTPGDIRMMQNVGPFKLKKGVPQDIVVAMIIGRGTDAWNSIAVAQTNDDIAQFIYNRNFETPPPPPAVDPVTVRTTDSQISLTWETANQVNYRNVAYADSARTKRVWDMQFEGYEVTAYRNPSTSAEEGGMVNSKIIARYDMANNISNIFLEAGDGSRTKIYQKGTQLDPAVFGTSNGRITLTITADPFTGGPLIKGKPYYFAITAYALNYDALITPATWGGEIPTPSLPLIGDYLLGRSALFTVSATFPNIITWGNPPSVGIRPGVDGWDPFQVNVPAAPGNSNTGEVKVSFEEVYKDKLTGNQYTVNFFQDSLSYKYQMFWKLKNNTTNTVLLDSQKVVNVDDASADPVRRYTQVVEGFRVKVDTLSRPAVKDPKDQTYSGTRWFETLEKGKTGAHYTGFDLADTSVPAALTNKYSKVIKANKLRQVEIRFDSTKTQKAYRYIPSITGSNYAAAPAAIQAGRPNAGMGFVDVPFQVWENDPVYKTPARQLAAGFFEAKATQDGKWKPGTDVTASKEYILIFDSPYTTDSLPRYTGGTFNSVTKWADPLKGWSKPAAWTNMTSQDSIIAASPWFDILYVVGFNERTTVDTTWWGVTVRDSVKTIKYDTLFFKNGDVFTIPVKYPIRSTDSFTFTTRKLKEGLNTAEQQAMWNKVNVFPNPLFAFNPGTSYIPNRAADDPYVTFSNLPPKVTVRIFTLTGVQIRSLTEMDKRLGQASPYLDWDLRNTEGLRVASGVYIALVSSEGFGQKVLKFSVILPQKQIQRY